MLGVARTGVILFVTIVIVVYWIVVWGFLGWVGLMFLGSWLVLCVLC